MVTLATAGDRMSGVRQRVVSASLEFFQTDAVGGEEQIAA
jgi:hypothetical protein